MTCFREIAIGRLVLAMDIKKVKVVMGQDEMLAVARIENGMENDSDSDDGAVQLNNPERGPDIFTGLVKEANSFSTGKI